VTTANPSEASTATVPLTQTQHKSFEPRLLTDVLLGPLVGVSVWLLPLGLDPAVQTAFAIALFMIVYWIQEPIDHAITALIGCYLFYALGVAKFSVAFSGFASSTPWFLFGALLMGEGASRTGLAKRLGYLVLLKVGTSYSRLLLGVITLSFLLNFLIPSGPARVTVIAPILLGVIVVFGLGTQSNVAKGLFLILTYTCGLFDKMIMSGASAILTRGIIEEQTGIEVLWSQWFLAYLPAIVITIFACWLAIQWFYPAEKALPDGKRYLHNSLKELGPWSQEEKKVLAWIGVTLALWTTDFIHHINPAAIGIGAGLFLTLPRVGVLDTKAVKQINFLVIAFSAGALSMGNVLTQTRVLHAVTDGLVTYIGPLLSNAFQSAIALYWGGILYHLLLANNQSMLSTSLPLLLQVTDGTGLNPVALGLIWVFAGGGNLFVYQSSVLVLGYSYGYFDGKDLLKVGAVLTFLEGLLLMVLVPFYWPLIGLNWLK
jgi:solute carrier family 13 (sodium-dependent dicarboxylate transporter), member 2/3/5